MNKKTRRIVLCILSIIASVMLCACSSNRNYEKVIKSYVDAQFTGDAEKTWKLLPPEMRECVLEDAKEELYLITEEEVIEYLQSQMQRQVMDALNSQLGEGWTYSYEISEIEDEEDLLELNKSYREMGANDFKATAAKRAEIIVSIESADGDYSKEQTIYVDIVKIDGKWYIGKL